MGEVGGKAIATLGETDSQVAYLLNILPFSYKATITIIILINE